MPSLSTGANQLEQEELQKATDEREALQRKMNDMQSKVIVGGVNLVSEL